MLFFVRQINALTSSEVLFRIEKLDNHSIQKLEIVLPPSGSLGAEFLFILALFLILFLVYLLRV